jgi:hypothetical protein
MRLDQLGHPRADKANAEGADLITEDLASGEAEGCSVKLRSTSGMRWVVIAGPYTYEPAGVLSILRNESEALPPKKRR